MATTSAIDTLIELATKECDKAAQELGKSIRLADETEKKLTMLLQYRDEYMLKLQVEQAKGLTIDGYRNYQFFLEKLEQAIAGQQQIVIESKLKVEGCQKAWQKAEHKKNVLRHPGGKKTERSTSKRVPA